MLFDNLGVLDITGPVLEETHYYPFGLTMSGISTTAPLKLEAKKKFNGIEFHHKEFGDGSGLDLYTAKFRGLDPQIGRWWQIDPKPDDAVSPYAAMELNPILNFDILGDTSWPIKNKWNSKTIQNYRDYAANAWKSYQKNGTKCTCEDFSLGVLIDFASKNNLPLVIVNGSGTFTFSAAFDKFNDVGSFKEAVTTHIAASDLKANTSKH